MQRQADHHHRFISTLVKNANYLNKQLTIGNISEFLKANPNFQPREALRHGAGSKGGQDNATSFECFLELNGFVQIGKVYVEMYIGVMRNYPHERPLFLVLVDRKGYEIHDEANLLRNRVIYLEKNQLGEEFVHLCFPDMAKNPKQGANLLLEMFNAMTLIINRPPLIRPKNESKVQQQQVRNGPVVGNNKHSPIDSKQVNQIITKLHTDMSDVLINKQCVADANDHLEYQLCRQVFLSQHLLLLQSKLKEKAQLAVSQSDRLGVELAEIEYSRGYDRLFEITEGDRRKLDILSQQQALKEAEVQLRSAIEKAETSKFGDYKKVMKILYDRMFDNQTELLKTLK